MTFSSILAAADFRRQPDPALVSGQRLARITGGTLHVLHCQEDPIPAGSAQASELPPGTEMRIRSGTPDQAIAEESAAVSADVIVLGARIRRSPVEGLLGTTAERVIRASRVPCLISNATLPETPGRILLALDRSAPARQAFRICTSLVGDLTAHAGAVVRVHLLTVSAYAQTGRRGVRFVDLPQYAEKLQAAAPKAAVTHSLLSAALPAEGILSYLDGFGADLVIMGTHGSGFLGRLLMGSVAQHVAREACVPLLLVPPRRGAGRNRLQSL